MTLLDVSPPADSTMSFADMQRSLALRRMKLVATSLLVFAAIVFVVAKVNEDSAAWVGYVRAVAEAAMVGALADWFAVTALFRHPLGLPIRTPRSSRSARIRSVAAWATSSSRIS